MAGAEQQNVVNGTTDAETHDVVENDADGSTVTDGTDKNNELTGSSVSAGAGNQTTASDTSDKNQKVTLTVNIKDIDDNNKVLWTKTCSGLPGAALPFSVSEYVSNELSQYRLVKDVQLSAFPDQNKVYDIYVKHNISTAQTNIFVPLHVEYFYSNGQSAAKPYFSDPLFETVKVIVTKASDGVTGVKTKSLKVADTAENAWLANIKIPKIPGHRAVPQKPIITRPDKPSDDPGDDGYVVEIKVIYTPIQTNKQKATIVYYDDDQNKVVNREDITGDSDEHKDCKSQIESTIHQLGEDYVLAKPIPEIVFYQDDSKDQTFEVHIKRATTPAHKDVKQTIHYVMSDGSNAPKDNKQTLTFHGIKNSAGKITWDNDKQKTFADVESPTITGYTPDKAVVKGATVTPDSKDITTTVTYTKNVIPQTDPDPVTQLITIRYVDPEDHVVKETKETVQPGDVITDKVPNGYTTTDGKTKITHTVAAGESLIIVHVVKPAVPDNGKHDEPTDPEKPVQPNIPKTPESSKPQAPAIADEPAAPATKRTAAPIQPAAPAAQLPQTSNKQNRAGLIGLAVAAAGLLLGLSGKRKKN